MHLPISERRYFLSRPSIAAKSKLLCQIAHSIATMKDWSKIDSRETHEDACKCDARLVALANTLDRLWSPGYDACSLSLLMDRHVYEALRCFLCFRKLKYFSCSKWSQSSCGPSAFEKRSHTPDHFTQSKWLHFLVKVQEHFCGKETVGHVHLWTAAVPIQQQ